MTADAASPQPAAPPGDTKQEHRPGTALAGASVGTFVEFYDFAVYALTVPIIASAFFPDGNSTAALLSALAVYGVAFVIRPLGGIVFGILGDRIGRRSVLMAVLLLIGISTALIGLLPTFDQVGYLAPALLVTLRLLQGLSAGGEVTSATSFALEHAPDGRRSRWITTVIAMSAVSSIVGLIVVLSLNAALSDEAFESWGWRIPFLIALPLSIVGLYIRLRTDESPAFVRAREKRELSSAPLQEALRTERSAIGFTIALAAMSALTFYYLVGYFPTYLQVTADMSRTAALTTNGIALAVFTAALILAGTIGDRIGRRTMIRVGVLALIVTSIPAFYLAALGGVASAAGQIMIAVSLAIFGGGSYATLLEIFPTRTRLTGSALGYNIGYAVFGGTAPLLAAYLVEVSGSPQAPGFYLAIMAVVVAVCAWNVPEARDLKVNR
ncbi:MAG: MFS transporter [Mycobacterium sp.]